MDDGDTRTAGTPGSTIDGPAGAPGRPDPWRLAAAATGLAVLVNAAAPWRSQHSPIIYGATGGGLGAEGLPLGLVPVAAVVIGLLAVRWWPVLLLAGAALTVPQALVPLVPSLAERPSLTYYIVLAGVPLVLIAVLAAAQECLDAGAVGTGAALAGATVGAGMIGTAVVGAGWLRITGTPAWLPLALALLAVAGGALAVRRTWPAWPPWRDRPGAGGAGRWR
ncbi:MAG TPA: hypothetical protein VES42_03510, partial [Pilimelia sp.]|nr:hypothetical protein [Pilimelia sp.]